MTPAILVAEQAKVAFKVHQYKPDPQAKSFGADAAAALGLPSEQVFKTLLVSVNGDNKQLAVAILPVAYQLNLKSMAKALAVKKVEMAEAKIAERSTGYVVGGISPLGQKKKLPTVLDQSAFNFPHINISAGKRGLEIELAAEDLQQLTDAIVAHISQ